MAWREPYDLVMFDLDGTLLETAYEITGAVNDTLLQFGWPVVNLSQVESWVGHGTRELLVTVLAWCHQISSDAARARPDMPEVVAAFDAHYDRWCGTHSRLYPHVREVLTGLHEKGVRVAVLTNKESRFVHRLLAAHNLLTLFHTVVCGDTYPNKKPHPMGVQACLLQWQVVPERALLVGDSATDVQTARQAGVAVWTVPYGYNQGQSVAHSQPDRMIPDFSALLP